MVKFVMLFMLAGAVILCLQARPLPDPTRPPDVMLSAPEMTSERMVAEPILQSVLISPTRKIAVISGQVVALHGVFEEFKLVSIHPSRVLLKNKTSEKILFLFPSEEQQFVTPRVIKKIPEQVQQK
jgi:MSHA biogenesis protein MshK